LKLKNKLNIKPTINALQEKLPITFAMPSPSPMKEYVKDITAARTETHNMLWRSGMNDITI